MRKLQAGRGTREELRQQGQRDLQELEALLGMADVVLPASAPERGSLGRRAWEGFAPPASAVENACALAVWAALDVPIEEVVLTWRATLAGVDPPPRGDGDAVAHEVRGSGYAQRRLDATARAHLTGPR
ncbi:hypothetical protein ACSRUE_42040 [Sorangium sp. KYC3313]|uniref:hypothetical protein n=1 Tax=Sorangium sp. KYC3313 TaxID=3449740 RepID=UPI003F8B14DE